MRKPGFTPIPNEIIDVHLPDLSGSETKVLLMIMRVTYGYHRDTRAISLSELSEKTGLSRTACSEATTSLKARRLILKATQKTDEGALAATTYEPLFEEQNGEGGVRPSEQGCSPQRTGGVRPSEQYKEERKQEIKKGIESPPASSSEETPRASVEFFLRRWGTIRGLKRPSASEREKVRERWTSVSISEEDLDCALDRFASWLKTKPDIRNPLLAFLKDPNSWGRSLAPKETTATIPPVECAALVPTQSTALALTWNNDPEYQAYAMAAALKGRRMTPAELEKGYELFAPLDAEKRRLSTEDYAYLADAASAPHFIPAPWKHLHGSPWENLRLPKKTETQLKYDRAVAIIREKQASGEWKS